MPSSLPHVLMSFKADVISGCLVLKLDTEQKFTSKWRYALCYLNHPLYTFVGVDLEDFHNHYQSATEFN